MKKHALLSVAAFCALQTANAAAFSDESITIWMPLDKGQKGMTHAVTTFEQDTGVKVIVEYPDGLEEKYVKASSIGKGPDVMIFAHDRFGGYAEAGLVREVTPSREFKQLFSDYTWEATRYKGKHYGYPITAESISLLYNKDLIDKPLENWEDLHQLDLKLSKQGKKAIAWEIKSPYFTQPLFSAAGAYVFERTETGLDASSTTVNSPQAVETMSFLKSLIDDGIISKDMDYAHAESDFNKGQVAMTINGPWAWANLDKTGINYGVAELPKYKGNPSKPFVGILMAGINSASPNKDLAQEFIEQYLLSIDSLTFMNSQVPIGVPALKSFAEQLSSDERLKASMINAENGELMPNIPEMMAFWSGQNAALTNIIDGRQSVEDALRDLEKRVLQK
ncbi:maltose/maltodextrin ABC transporter substrate-binding protein MalE [Vibrio ulleungensis]|uniref:Maltodextrin-binding protein n=1 Tax=Vibrio ulleungensis TaxID=2807619 RepID=A0ABS2HCV6_9VIBR|nr:maltose/maltodextrin ABC transporter substrate-binding protein MalE [Vibrio ulleungensis]MBM7035428.1 maltose/maltodextrin ABC transporter substrate-binding protein MalE [Vibrio ulleungensis]